MATMAADQVIVGKMSLPKAGGQVSLLDPPQSFAWLGSFSAEEIAEFLSELLEALHQSQKSGDWSIVAEMLAAWKETAEIKADPVMSTEVEQGLRDLSEGRTRSWASLREELDL